MTDQIEWDPNMSPEDFITVSKPYFLKKYINLHEGCCLYAKENPVAREAEGRIVGEGFRDWETQNNIEYDHTRRAYRLALESLRGNPKYTPLTAVEEPQIIRTGKDVLINTRTFMAWAIAELSATARHLETAEKAYQAERKKTSPSNLIKKSGPVMNDIARREAFFRMVEKHGLSLTNPKPGKWAEMLEEVIKDEDYKAKWETLRKKIVIWIEEYWQGENP